MNILTAMGAGWQSRLLTIDRAAELVRVLSADPRYRDVSVDESQRATTEARFRVTYYPAAQHTARALLALEQNKRRIKAIEEGPGYRFVRDEVQGRPVLLCHSLSGEVYDVGPNHCTCPDFTDRCAHVDLSCKHIIAAQLFEGADGPQHWETVPTPQQEDVAAAAEVQARKAAARADIEYTFR